MELDELKQAFRTLDRRLDVQAKLNFQVRTERMLDRTQASLRPLVWGHFAQVAFGVLLAVVLGRTWVENFDKLPLLIAGILLHGYSILLIALGGRMLWLLHSMDFAEPVLSIQKQLEIVRRSYVNSGLVVGLPWWVLWIPFAMLAFGVAANLAWLVSSTVFGIAGILATLWYIHRSRSRSQRIQDALSGNSLRRAQNFLDEIKQFEME